MIPTHYDPFPQESVYDEPDYSEAIGSESDPARTNLEMLELVMPVQAKWAKQAVSAEALREGQHWTSEQISKLAERGQTATAIQATYQFVEQAIGNLTANNPAFLATAVEDGDTKAADVWKDLFAHMWNKSLGKLNLTQVMRDSYTTGRGVAYPFVNPDLDFGRGEVVWKDLDPLWVFPDPSATHPLWDDAGWVISVVDLTLQQVQQLFGSEIAKKLWADGEARTEATEEYWTGEQVSHNDEQVRRSQIAFSSLGSTRIRIIERFEKIRTPHFRVFNPDTGRDLVFNEIKYNEHRELSAYIVMTGGIIQVVTEPDRVEQLDQTFKALGPEFHMMPGASQVGPSGELLAGQPFPMPGPEHEGSIPGSGVMLTPTTIGALIDDKIIPVTGFKMPRCRVTTTSGQTTIAQVTLPTSHYPTVPFQAVGARTVYPTGEVSRVKDLQFIINKSNSLILAHASSSTNIKVFYPDGAVDDIEQMKAEWGKAGAAFIPYNPAIAAMSGANLGPNGGIVIAAPPPLPTALYTNLDRALGLMERILGLYAFQEGDTSNAPNTYRGTLALDEMGARRMRHRIKMQHVSLTRLGEVMRDFAQATYTEEKVLRIVQPDQSVRETIINGWDRESVARRINDITVGYFDVRVVAGSMMDSNRWAKMGMDLDLFDRGIVDDIAVLEHSEYPDAAEILERKSVLSQQRQTIENLVEQMKDLQGLLQTKSREVIGARERTEVEKFKAKLATALAEAESNLKVVEHVAKQQQKRQEQDRRDRERERQQRSKQTEAA